MLISIGLGYCSKILDHVKLTDERVSRIEESRAVVWLNEKCKFILNKDKVAPMAE